MLNRKTLLRFTGGLVGTLCGVVISAVMMQMLFMAYAWEWAGPRYPDVVRAFYVLAAGVFGGVSGGVASSIRRLSPRKMLVIFAMPEGLVVLLWLLCPAELSDMAVAMLLLAGALLPTLSLAWGLNVLLARCLGVDERGSESDRSDQSD